MFMQMVLIGVNVKGCFLVYMRRVFLVVHLKSVRRCSYIGVQRMFGRFGMCECKDICEPCFRCDGLIFIGGVRGRSEGRGPLWRCCSTKMCQVVLQTNDACQREKSEGALNIME